jgi:hypothetical protein
VVGDGRIVSYMDFAMPVGLRGGRSRLTGSAGRVLPARGQSFNLKFK